MPPLTRIICLANSRKHGAYCVAGIEPDTGAWIRPVSHLDDGRVERSMLLVNGRAPSLGDVLEIPLAATGPDYGFESENLSILPGPWHPAGSVSPGELMPFCSQDRFILHNAENHVTVQYLQSLPFEERRTLQLVEGFEFEAFSTGLSAQGGHRWYGAFVSHFGERLRARITDPVLVEKLENGYQPGPHCLVTVSLSMPYRPDDWGEDVDPCWKLIAGVVELQPGVWVEGRCLRPPATAQPPLELRKTPAIIDDAQVQATLKKTFGFDAFRPNQEEIVRTILNGKDCFVVMPTGGGKSLCYQLPAHLLPGTCLVISPLISLMKDQVDAARGNGLNAACINSSQTDHERIRVFRELEAGRIDLLYVSPERFAMETFLNNLKHVSLCLGAIDEAHCISEWGHDFRPDYLHLAEIIEHFPDIPVAAFTATATHRVQQDIIERLGLRGPHIVRASFDRPNLLYEVIRKTNVDRQILDFVRRHQGKPGIVYRTTRAGVQETTDLLRAHDVRALPYHAGLGDDARSRNQEAFNRDEVDVVVATIAFGLGIDKSNVRFVVHGDLPKNMEAYYQETGRGGRDGETAYCLLLFGRGDIPKIRYFIDQMSDETERRRTLASLNEMVNYAGATSVCRRRRILAYFGEDYEKDNCGSCDVCTGRMDSVDATIDAQMILSAIVRTGERFGAGHVIDVVRGANTRRIRSFSHNKLPTHGVGKSKDKQHWRQVVDDLSSLGAITQSEDQFPVLRLTQQGRAVLFGRQRVTVLRRKEMPEPSPRTARAVRYEQGLFERLRDLRRRLATARNVPPYVVFSDRSLYDMASRLPTSEGAFLRIHGVGETKLGLYGNAFLEEIRAYLAASPEMGQGIDSGGDVVPLPREVSRGEGRRGKGSTVEVTWGLIQEGLAIDQIASQRGLTRSTIVKHIERLILGGKDIDIDRFVRPEVRLHLEDLLKKFGAGSLREIIEEASLPVSHDEVRLIGVWIRSRRHSG